MGTTEEKKTPEIFSRGKKMWRNKKRTHDLHAKRPKNSDFCYKKYFFPKNLKIFT
jgi:hypothetical protein